MARNGSGVYSLPAGSTVSNGDTSDATDLNTPLTDIETDLNTARPIVAGGTGASTDSGARTNLKTLLREGTAYSADLDDLTETGVYPLTTGASNHWSTAAAGDWVFNFYTNANTGYQLGFDGGGTVWRRINSSGWSSWAAYINQAQVLDTAGWHTVETVYDFSTDGAQASAETSDFADGWEYGLILENLSFSTTAQIAIEAYRATDAAYATAITPYNSAQGASTLWSGNLLLVFPRRTSNVHTMEHNIYNGLATPSDSGAVDLNRKYAAWTHATAQKIGKLRISASAGNMDAGTVTLIRRPVDV